jgi:hypothetical protein
MRANTRCIDAANFATALHARRNCIEATAASSTFPTSASRLSGQDAVTVKKRRKRPLVPSATREKRCFCSSPPFCMLYSAKYESSLLMVLMSLHTCTHARAFEQESRNFFPATTQNVLRLFTDVRLLGATGEHAQLFLNIRPSVRRGAPGPA